MTPAQARELLASPELLATATADYDVGELRAAELLRARWPAGASAAALEQVELRRRAGAKFTRADRMLLTRAGLEQASGEPVARHRAGRFAALRDSGDSRPVLDLCCGIGGDLVQLAGAAGPVIGVDRDETSALFARHNCTAYDVEAAVAVADVVDVRPMAAAVFVDPARRQAQSGSERRGGYSPALDWCTSLPVEHVCVKAAPGLDRTVVPPGWETEFVADGRELKEAVLWSPAWARAASSATVLRRGVARTLHDDGGTPPAAVGPPGAFLLDPSPAVTRAGAVALLAQQIEARQIDKRIAFLTADHPLESWFGRSFLVEASLPFAVKPLTAELRRLDVGPVELRRRGLAGDVDELRRRLRTGGSRRATVMLTRVDDRPWALVCTERPRPDDALDA